MLDSFDVMLYAIVLAALLTDPVLQLSQSTAGILGSITLIAAAFGGIVFGVVADRLGRKKALMGAVLIYSVFTAACGFAQNVAQLAIFRILLGIGMGGVGDRRGAGIGPFPPSNAAALAFYKARGRLVRPCAANLIVMPIWGWRGVFFVGVVPALFTI